MPTPLEDHGGVIPSADHPMRLPDVPNRLTLVIHTSEPNFNMELYTSLVLNRVAIIYVVLPTGASPSTPYIHPLVHYVSLETNIVDFLKTKVLTPTNPHVFVYEMTMGTTIDSSVWSVLETATPGSSTQFKSTSGETQALWCINSQGVCPLSVLNNSIPTRTVQDITSTTLSEIAMDVSQSYTPLCHWATRHMTDKTPYMIQVHRHPYTPVYDMLLRPFQLQPTLKFGEVGVLNGSSIRMWREYFPQAAIHGFDITVGILAKISSIPGVTGHLIDPTDVHGCVPCLQEATADGVLFDILLEDASHMLNHQLHFLKDAIHYVRPGGLLIIEDIFRAIPAARFQEALDTIKEKVHNAVLIRPEHTYRFSPGWENDRILVVWVK
jgi:hypothetical protein